MSLWIALVVFVLVTAVCIAYVACGAMDPEGRGMPNEKFAFAGGAAALLMAAAVAGALVHRGLG